MSDLPYIQYRLQSASHPNQQGQSHLLVTAHYTPTIESKPKYLKQQWYFASSGPLSEYTVNCLQTAWDEAKEEVERSLFILGQEPIQEEFSTLLRPKQPLSVQLKQLSNQVYRFDEPETTMELELDINDFNDSKREDSQDENSSQTEEQADQIPVHLVICLAENSRHSPPPVKDLSPLESITIIFEDESPMIWPWASWAVHAGAQMIFHTDHCSTQLQNLIMMSARVRSRIGASFHPTMEGKFHALISLNAPMIAKFSNPLDPIRVPLCPPGQRLAWLMSVEPKHHGDGARELLFCEVYGGRYVIQDYPTQLDGLESSQLAVSFAQQLVQRGRILELIISSYLNSDLRRVVQGLDQWVKLSVSLEEEAVCAWVHNLKIKFLHLGRFEPEDFKRLIRHALHVPYQLTSDGTWCSSPLNS